MPSASRGELRQARKVTYLASLAVAVLGSVCLLTYLYLARGGTKGVFAEILYALSNVFLSASLVSLIVSLVSLNETNLSTEATIERAIDESLVPMRGLIHEGGQADYRWICVLSLPKGAAPHAQYALQRLQIHKILPHIPPELKLACIATYSDEDLQMYSSPDEYIFRWLVDEELDPRSSDVFDVVELRLDGRELTELSHPATPSGKLAHTYSFRVPRDIRRDQAHRISFTVLVRKHIGNDTRLSIKTQLFQPTFGAAFHCLLDPSLGADKAWVSGSEVTRLGGGHLEPPYKPNNLAGEPHLLSVVYHSPLQSGSAVTFNLDRRPNSADASAE